MYDGIVEDCKKDNPIDQDEVLNNIKSDITKLKLEKSNLTRLICKNLISDNEFLEQKNNYQRQILKLEQRVEEISKGKNDNDDVLKDISLMLRAKRKFNIGTPKEKK